MSDNTIHATCINMKGRGILLLGDSGTGKSDLALRMIDMGAHLVADDQVSLRVEDGMVIASPPTVLASLLEVRGLGIFRFPGMTKSALALVIQLVPQHQVVRMPLPATHELLGVKLPMWKLHAFEESAPNKIKLLADALGSSRMLQVDETPSNFKALESH